MAIQNYADNGAFAPRKIVDALRTTSDELARSLGLGKDERHDACRKAGWQHRGWAGLECGDDRPEGSCLG